MQILFYGSAMWSASCLGALYGVMKVAPDHLGTLVALSAAATPRRAFAVGASWALGHCMGGVIVTSGSLLASQLAGGHHFKQQLEHYGNYCIGASMVFIAAYFASKEASHLQTLADGSSALKPCKCASPAVQLQAVTGCAASASHGQVVVESGGAHAAKHDGGACASRVSRQHGAQHAAPARQKISSALLGVFQGLCCPCGLLGVSLVAELSVPGLVAFTAAFVAVAVVSTGAFSASWGSFTRRGLGRRVSHRALYRISNGFTGMFGIIWIAATAWRLRDARLRRAMGVQRGRVAPPPPPPRPLCCSHGLPCGAFLR
jgi:hypothetical protein